LYSIRNIIAESNNFVILQLLEYIHMKITLTASLLFCLSLTMYAQVTRTGDFIQNSNIYPISGTATYTEVNSSEKSVKFEDNFATIQGIRLEVFLSTDGDYDETDDYKISSAPLDEGSAMSTPINGPMSFVVPSDVNIAEYEYVIVQCTNANILWGAAKLGAPQGEQAEEETGGHDGSAEEEENVNDDSSNVWTTIDAGEGIKPSLSLDNSGIPHIAYINEDNAGFIKIAALNGDQFESTLVSEGYFYAPLDLTFTADNFGIIGYHDHDVGDGEYALATESASGWSIETIDSPGHDGWDNSLYLDDDGDLHLLSVDPNSDLEYAYKDGDEWVVEQLGIGSTTYRYATDIQVVNDVVYAVGYKSSTDELMIATRTDGNWTTELVTIGGRYPSLHVSDDGDIKIAFYRRITDYTGSVELAHRANVGWEFSVIDTLSNVDQGNARNVVSLVREGVTDHVAYSDMDALKMAISDGNSWDIETVLDVSAEPTRLGGLTSLRLDPEGKIHLSIFRAMAGAEGGGVIMYITNKTLEPSSDVDAQTIRRQMSFQIADTDGNTLSDADITITSESGQSTIVQSAFLQYSVETLENVDDEIKVCVSLDAPSAEGLSAVQIFRAQRIVLDLVEACPENRIAADVDESNSVSAVDLVLMRNVIVGNTASFPGKPSWIFMRGDEIKSCDTFSVNDLPNSEIRFTGIKKGKLDCMDTPRGLKENNNWKN